MPAVITGEDKSTRLIFVIPLVAYFFDQIETSAAQSVSKSNFLPEYANDQLA